ncbi:MAG: hypothetical protein KGH80_01375 [Xanthomonadaceae bacterium]|nr:hypothetical protein [Xanthomonadaceae bacterium]
MAKVLPPPILVVRTQRPARRWRWAAAVALLWLASLAGAMALQHWLVGIGEHMSVAHAQQDRDAWLQKIAIAERAEQVARAANADLQQSLRDRQEEIAGLRADLAFYSKLTDGRSKPEGLAVHGVRMTAAGTPNVYNFTVTLTQTLKSGQVASGRVRLSVDGIRAGKLATLAWTDLAPNQDASGLPFSFKYFQQVGGTVMLPAGFAPNRVHVEADAGGDMGRADQDFAWSDALTDQEPADVQP